MMKHQIFDIGNGWKSPNIKHPFLAGYLGFQVHPRKLTASFPLKTDGWKMILSFGQKKSVTFQGRTVKLRGGGMSSVMLEF